MSIKDKLTKALQPDDLQKVLDALGDDFDFDMVPRSRLNKVIQQRNELKELVSGKKTEKEKDDNSGEDGEEGDLKSVYEQKIAALEAAHQKTLESTQKQYAVLDKLREAKAVDPDIILKSGLLKVDELKFNDKGELEGLTEQLTELSKTKSYLFQPAEEPAKGTGKAGGQKKEVIDDQLTNIFTHYGVRPIERMDD